MKFKTNFKEKWKEIEPRKKKGCCCAFLLIFLVSYGIWYSNYYEPQLSTEYMVSMRDNVRLATDVYLPEGEGPFPALVFRTPYGKELGRERAKQYMEHGIVFVSQDHRGTYQSEGEYSAFIYDGVDAADTLLWMKQQPWFNGIYATLGESAMGITQYKQMGHLDDIVCQYIEVATPHLYTQALFQGGTPRKMLAENWLAKRGDGTFYHSHVFPMRTINSDFAQKFVTPQTTFSHVTWPSIHQGGWYDCFSQGIIDGFMGYQYLGGEGGQGNAKLIMGPWTHNYGEEPGQLVYPENSKINPGNEIFESMFSEQIFGKNMASIDWKTAPNITYYVMGDVNESSTNWNQWATAQDWPIPHTNQSYYLQNNFMLSTSPPSSSEEYSFLFDPSDPVETYGGNNLIRSNRGPWNQTEAESGREDVLQFNIDIQEELLITGRVSVKLFVRSNCTDTDFTAKLVDVYPDGRDMLIMDGIQRLRWRDGYEEEKFGAGDSTIYEITIDLWSTAYVFNVGHQLRLSLSSSNFPRFDLNPNTGADIWPINETTPYNIAQNTIISNSTYPSALQLPIPTIIPNFVDLS